MESPAFATMPVHPLAPDAPAQPSLQDTFTLSPDEEKELRQVSLFVQLLEVIST